jgi:mannose/fructose/N-acetylgalactosamine-specific phosphotransferase system component IIC
MAGHGVSGPVLLTGLLGGWLAADATAFAQLLVSQPLVGGTLAGWVWGDGLAGMRVGALLQLFALSGLPLGGRTPDDYATAGVVGPSVALLVSRTVPAPPFSAALVLGVAAGLVVAMAGRPLIRWLRVRNEGLTRWAESEVADGRVSTLDRAHWLGVMHAFAIGAGFTWIGVTGLTAVARWAIEYDGLAVEHAASLSEPVLWGVGAGLAARQMVPLRKGTALLFLTALAFWVVLRWLGKP